MASKGLVWGGVGAALAAVTLGGACLVTGAFVKSSTVAGFARAPIGCTTTLEFDTSDTFTLYAETRGRVDDTGGGCALSGTSFEHTGEVPALTLTMVGPGGGEVRLGDRNDFSYDVTDFTGSSYATLEVPASGTYRLTVAGDADDLVVAIGRDPERDSLVWVAAGMTIAVLGMAIGLVLVILGVRRKPEPPAPPAVWGVTVGTNMVGYTPVGAPPPPHMPAPPGAGPWSTLPPPPPPSAWPPAPPRPPSPGPHAPGAGPALPPPPPPREHS